MNKFVCLIISALVATSLAQEGSTGIAIPELVPFAASICAATCPTFCNGMATVCNLVPFASPACELAKANCLAFCTQACTCVTNCGPNCDDFEDNCRNFDIPVMKGVFCPVVGKVCDTACVVECPQAAFANLLLRVANQLALGLQQFVGMCFSVLSGALGIGGK